MGVPNENIKKMFDMEKNADLVMERDSKMPQNNEQLRTSGRSSSRKTEPKSSNSIQ